MVAGRVYPGQSLELWAGHPGPGKGYGTRARPGRLQKRSGWGGQRNSVGLTFPRGWQVKKSGYLVWVVDSGRLGTGWNLEFVCSTG